MYGYEHWPRLATMDNPVGYLFRVGQSRTRPRRVRALAERWGGNDPGDVLVEPRLDELLRELSVAQRAVVGTPWGGGAVGRWLAASRRSGRSTVECSCATGGRGVCCGGWRAAGDRRLVSPSSAWPHDPSELSRRSEIDQVVGPEPVHLGALR